MRCMWLERMCLFCKMISHRQSAPKHHGPQPCVQSSCDSCPLTSLMSTLDTLLTLGGSQPHHPSSVPITHVLFLAKIHLTWMHTVFMIWKKESSKWIWGIHAIRHIGYKVDDNRKYFDRKPLLDGFF